MSGVGKTFYSKKLEKEGFDYFGCDEEIEKKLESELNDSSFSGVNDVGRWMGQPFDKRYKNNSKKYLSLEKEVVSEIISKIKQVGRLKTNLVIDTTGSVIYLDNDLLLSLKENSFVLYLDTPKKTREEMQKRYFEDPKPVYWGDSFQKKSSEGDIEALKRCYPLLLEEREKKYKLLADKILTYGERVDNDFCLVEFLKKNRK
jgi:shikimate kinase